MISYSRDVSTLNIATNYVELQSGFTSISVEIPITDFKQKLFYTFMSGEPTSYGFGSSTLRLVKITDKYSKVLLRLFAEGGDNGSISIFPNDLVWLALKLREIHLDSEEWFICDDQIKVSRNNGTITLNDRRINYSTELSPVESEKLWGTMLMRCFGVPMDGIFGDVALLGNVLKFPFSVKKKRIVNPLTLKDTAKLLSIL